MASSQLKKAPIVGTVIFAAVALCVAGFAILVGWQLYASAAKPPTDFYAKLGELALQLAVVVIVGAFVKELVEWGASQRARYAEKIEARKEFMRRVRAMHVAVQNARDLMNAHRSPKTWGEQSRRLMELRPEVEEISEDLKASGNLFANQIAIVDGLEKIIAYLQSAGDEYVRSHDAVDNGHKTGRSLVSTLEEKSMTWVRDFMAGGEGYKANYEANLTKSKGAMRSEVYGA
jgi:hypothetical protein